MKYYEVYGFNCMELIEHLYNESTERNGIFWFLAGNILKYTLRFKHKGQSKSDLEKLKWYLNKINSPLDVNVKFDDVSNHYLDKIKDKDLEIYLLVQYICNYLHNNDLISKHKALGLVEGLLYEYST